jgi:hypothetical protein
VQIVITLGQSSPVSKNSTPSFARARMVKIIAIGNVFRSLIQKRKSGRSKTAILGRDLKTFGLFHGQAREMKTGKSKQIRISSSECVYGVTTIF